MVFKTRKGWAYFGEHHAFNFDGHYFEGPNPFVRERDIVIDITFLVGVYTLCLALVMVLK